MIPKSFRSAPTALLGALALAAAGPALAQAYPDRPVTLVVPFAAGGPTDVVARMMSVPMAKSLGQQVVVENTVGAGGTIAATRVARAKPDGYTIFIHHMGMSTAPALYRKLTFDPLNDYEYVGQVVDVPMTLLARKDFPANTLPELLAYIRANKDKVTLANAGQRGGGWDRKLEPHRMVVGAHARKDRSGDPCETGRLVQRHRAAARRCEVPR